MAWGALQAPSGGLWPPPILIIYITTKRNHWEYKGLTFGYCPKQHQTPPPPFLDTGEVLVIVKW